MVKKAGLRFLWPKKGLKSLLNKKQKSACYGTKSRTQIVMVLKTGLKMICYQKQEPDCYGTKSRNNVVTA